MKLGDMIDWLEAWTTIHQEKADTCEVRFDFGALSPHCLDSWRGVYAELAIGWTADDAHELTVRRFHKLLSGAVGAVYDGYKGGEYRMDRDTPVHVDNPGRYTNTCITGLRDDGHQVTILTTYDPN